MDPLRVLIVDDDEDIRTIARYSLTRLGGHTVFEATSGIEALARVSTEMPDVILLDVMMPGLDGPDTLQRLRQDREFDGIAVIFLTARVQHAEVAHYRELGAAGVIPKPFDPLILHEQVQTLVQGVTQPD